MLTITTNSFENDVLHADKPVLVDFWAQWCPYCRRIAPAFDKVGEQYADTLIAGKIIRNLLGELAEKNLRLNEKLTHMGQRTTRAKLLSYFSGEAQRWGGYEFDIPFSRQQLADYLGVERSGLSLELGKMRDEGLLDFHKSHFILKV